MIDLFCWRCRKSQLESIEIIEDVFVNIINRPVAFIGNNDIKEVRRKLASIIFDLIKDCGVCTYIDPSICDKFDSTELPSFFGISER